MKLSDLGERRAIDRMADIYGTVSMDDCATLDIDGGDGAVIVATTDLVSEPSHFPPGATPRQMGWFVVAVNLSDLAGTGARPLGVLLSLGLPASLDAGFIEGFSEGAKDCATTYGTAVIGGDTKETRDITLCGTALGRMNSDASMSRRGAVPGDLIYVTGTLGRAGAALQRLHDGTDGSALHDLLHVEPRVEAGMALADACVVHAAMDISDGLADSLHQLARLNECGFAVDADTVPVAPGATLQHALYDGGDYELLFTAPPDERDAVTAALHDVGCRCTVVGEVIPSGLLLRRDGTADQLERRGYEHFSQRGKTL